MFHCWPEQNLHRKMQCCQKIVTQLFLPTNLTSAFAFSEPTGAFGTGYNKIVGTDLLQKQRSIPGQSRISHRKNVVLSKIRVVGVLPTILMGAFAFSDQYMMIRTGYSQNECQDLLQKKCSTLGGDQNLHRQNIEMQKNRGRTIFADHSDGCVCIFRISYGIWHFLKNNRPVRFPPKKMFHFGW